MRSKDKSSRCRHCKTKAGSAKAASTKTASTKAASAGICENELGPAGPGGRLKRRVSACLPRGKSGLHRAACRLTAGGARSKRASRKGPQKKYRPRFRLSGLGQGKGEKVR